MGVQALHTSTGPADTTRRRWTTVSGPQRSVPLSGCLTVRGRNGFGVHLGLGPIDAPGGLEGAHGPVQLRVDQPVTGGHRCAIVEQRFVADHHGVTVAATHHDPESGLGVPTESLADRFHVGRCGFDVPGAEVPGVGIRRGAHGTSLRHPRSAHQPSRTAPPAMATSPGQIADHSHVPTNPHRAMSRM